MHNTFLFHNNLLLCQVSLRVISLKKQDRIHLMKEMPLGAKEMNKLVVRYSYSSSTVFLKYCCFNLSTTVFQ